MSQFPAESAAFSISSVREMTHNKIQKWKRNKQSVSQEAAEVQ